LGGGSAGASGSPTGQAGTGGGVAGTSAGMGGAGGPSSAGTGGSTAVGGFAGASGGGGATAGQAGAGGFAGSSGGGAGGGAGGSGGAPPDAAAAAQVLNGFTLLKPCVEPNFKGCCCEETAETENQHVTKQFGGSAAVTYRVKLRVAGVAERYWYAGGELDATSQVFYLGGLPTIHSAKAPNTNLGAGQGACKIHPPETDGQFKLPFTVPVEIRPSDGCYNGFNIFAMTVKSAKGTQSYYLNYTTDFDNVDRQPHAAYKTDYTVTIPIPGQAQLDFYTIDGDHHQVANDGTMQVPNLKTPQPYNGNFLELTVVDVTTD
jgi:hypothetical protein